MRAAIAGLLLLSLALAGCTFPSGKQSSCGDRQTEHYDGLSDTVNVQTENGFTERRFSYASDQKACVDQHANYTVRVEVAPGTTAGCTDDPLSVVVQQQAGFTGRTLPALDPQAATTPGGYVYEHSDEIGLRQFKQPQYIFVSLVVSMSTTGDAAADAACLASRIGHVEVTGRYLLPNEEAAEG